MMGGGEESEQVGASQIRNVHMNEQISRMVSPGVQGPGGTTVSLSTVSCDSPNNHLKGQIMSGICIVGHLHIWGRASAVAQNV